MKKLLFLLVILILTGCGNQNDSSMISYDDSYYLVATPYKESAGSYSIRDYDKEEVEYMLSKLSTEYFKISNSLYQEGQYLTTNEIRTLVNEYNKTEKIIIDAIEIQPSYITTIYEQNYLNSSNELKGISLAIVVDNKQYYNDNKYKVVDEKIVLNYAIDKADDLISYIHSKEGLENINIVLGIYLEEDLKGGFKYLGSTNNNEIDLKHVNYNYQILESNYIMTNDNETYNNFMAIKNSLGSYNSYINSYGLYQDKTLKEVKIIINKSYFKRSEILNMVDIITNNLNNFNNVDIKIYFKSDDVIKAFINKNINETKINTYILED